jgi:hypothetical protein
VKRSLLFLLCVALILAACNIPIIGMSPQEAALATVVAMTLQAITPPSLPLATPTLAPVGTSAAPVGLGSVGGGIYGYPKKKIPSLTVVAFSVNSPYWYYFITMPGSTYYSIDILPPGLYHVVAYDNQGQSGGYTAGGQLVDVAVEVGKTSPADINDWSGSFPSNPLK